MDTREANLAKNTIIFALGGLGSKLIQVFLVPFYTRILTSGEYGTVDMMVAIEGLLMPIISLSISEAVFRYAMEKDCDKRGVLTVGMLVTAAGTALMCLLGIPAMSFTEPSYVWLVIGFTAVNTVWTILSQYTRATGHSMLFAVNNIVLTAAVLGANILLLAVFRLGITGYMLGYIIANLIACGMLAVCLKGDCRLSLKAVTKPLFREMMIFALPLVLNGICWWLSNFTDRVMITGMLGTSQNGLYAAASKIPHLISVIATIFLQAWQISANEELRSEDGAAFYSEIYEQISACVFLLSAFLILFCRPLNSVFLGADYREAWIAMPPLVLSSAFFSFGAFLLSIYSANKRTGMAFVTNLVCVVVNIVLNYVFILWMGMVGAAVATAVSYVVLWVIRIRDTRKILRLTYHTGRIIAASLLVIVQSVITCLDLNTVFTWVSSSVITAAVVLLYARTLAGVVRFGLNLAGKLLHRG